MTNLKYGDRVLATYRNTRLDPNPITREGVVVEQDFGDDLTEIYFGTVEEYERLIDEDGGFQGAHDSTGVFYPDEIKLKDES